MEIIGRMVQYFLHQQHNHNIFITLRLLLIINLYNLFPSETFLSYCLSIKQQ